MANKVSTTAVLTIHNPETGLEAVEELVLNSVPSPHSRRAYKTALGEFFYWRREFGGGAPFAKATVQKFAVYLREERKLAPATVNVRLTVLRRLAAEAADNGLMDPALAQGIGRVKGAKQEGVRTGNWLTLGQAEKLLQAPDPSRLKGLRDRALLAVLIGCGLRRAEASALAFSHVQQRDGRWAIVDLQGKGGRIRTVPMPAWAKVAVDQWAAAAGLVDGRVFRSLNNRGELAGERLDPKNILDAVTRYARALGLDGIAPHDLRRTFAKLAHKGGSPLEQIQLSLGHSSIVTTEKYLGVKQNLQDAPCDRLGLLDSV